MPYYINKRYNIHEVVPGMQLAKIVLTETGQVALSEGAILNPSLIERLKYWGVYTVEIREWVEDEAKVSEESLPESQQQKFFNSYQSTVRVVKKAFETMRYFKETPISEMRELVDEAIDPLVETTGVINHLHLVERKDDYTFHHSLNVAVICGTLGKWVGYTGVDLKDLILAGLLHDMGKTQIPLEILNKPGGLTVEEMDVMKKHPAYGYNMIKEIKHLPLAVMYAVLQHHERMDGGGYPLSLPGNKIHPFAKIVAIADVYDAMTSDRVYHKKISPFHVVETLVGEMYDKLDPEFCTVFLNNVRDFFVGSIVILNDGREAEVLCLGQYAASRPVVRTTDGEFIDLEKCKELGIVNLSSAQ